MRRATRFDRPTRGPQDRAGRLRNVELEARARRNDLDRLAVDREVGVPCGSADAVRERPEVRVGGGSTDGHLGRLAARQAEQLGEPPARHAEAPARSAEHERSGDGHARTLRCSGEHLPAHRRRRHPNRKRGRARRALDLPERADDDLRGRVAIEASSRSLRLDLEPEAASHDRRVLRLAIHVVADLVERVARARRSRRRAAAAPRRRTPARAGGESRAAARSRRPHARPPRRRHLQSGSTAELVGCEAIAVRPGDELHRIVRALLEERIELRHRLPLRQPADVDARDLRPGCQLAPRAREREADEDREDDDRCRRRPRSPPGSSASADDDALRDA